MNNINNMHTSRECESWIVAASASDRWICSNYFYWKWSCSITRGCFLTNISMLVRSWQDMLLSLQRPIRVLGEVTTVNMSFHASYQSKDGQSMLLGGFGIGFFRVLFWLFQLLNGQEWQIWDDDPDGPSYLAFIYITYIYIHYIYTLYIYYRIFGGPNHQPDFTTRSRLGGLANFPLTYNAVPGYCGWPNSVLSPVAQFDLSYLASASELQLTSGLYSNTEPGWSNVGKVMS